MKYVILTLFVMLSAVILNPVHNTTAHGDMKVIYTGTTEGYDITVKTIPHDLMVGQAHFSIEPKNSVTGEVIAQALITLIVRLDDEAFQSRAVNSPSSPAMYDANITFFKEGEWEVEVKIETTPGKESSLYFNVDVSGESIVSGTGAGFFFIFIFTVLVLGTLILSLKYRRRAPPTN